MKEYCRKINILMGVINRGGGSKSHILRNAGLRWDHNGGVLIDDLIVSGHLSYLKLRGDRNYVSITDKGRLLIRDWIDFEKNFT